MALALDLGKDFTTHKSRLAGGGFLKAWKDDGVVEVWLHQKVPIYVIWSHNWFRYSIEKDKQSEQEFEVLRNMRVNCLERDAVSKRQTYRKKDGSREIPPVICPHCLMIEWVRGEVRAGRMSLDTPVFEWQTEGPSPDGGTGEQEILYAGGLTGWFGKKDLTAGERDALHRTGWKQSEVYKQSVVARMQYVFTVLSNRDLDSGWVIAVEGQALGDKVKKAINDEIKRCGGDHQLGNPAFNPYPFEWTYDANKEFGEMYDVVALSRQAPSPAVKVLLETGEPPNTDRVTGEPFLGSLRQSYKDACRIDNMPIDSFFELAIEQFGERYEEGEEEEVDPEALEAGAADPALPSAPASAQQSLPVTTSVPANAPVKDAAPAADASTAECAVCLELMAETDETCPHCGSLYATDSAGNVFIASRPCGVCKHPTVPVEDFDPEHRTVKTGAVCPKCKAVHDEHWNAKAPVTTAAAAAPAADAKPASRMGSARRAPTSTAASAATAPATHSDAQQSRRSRARAVTSK